jgi:hypothetical protein
MSRADDAGKAGAGGRPLRERVPFDQELTRTHAALWAVILAATAMDIVLTMTGLGLGLQEGNVLVRRAIAAFGPAGLFVVKAAAMAWLVGGWLFLSERNATIFLALFAVVTVTVSGYNAVLIVQSGAM